MPIGIWVQDKIANSVDPDEMAGIALFANVSELLEEFQVYKT